MPNATPDSNKAKALVGLGNTCLTLGNAAEAIKCYTSALEIYQRIHLKKETLGNQNMNPDGCHQDIASTLKNLGKAYQALGQVEEAHTYYYEACMMLYPGIAIVITRSLEAPLVNASGNCKSNYHT